MLKIKNILGAFLIIFSIPLFVFAENSNQSVSVIDLQKQIESLLKQLQALQQQVSALQGELGQQPETATPAPSEVVAPQQSEVSVPEFTRSLSRGSSGDDVRQLQEFLSKDKEIYPNGLVTGYFGPMTEMAVKKWQEKYNIESIGVVGPKTIAKFQEIGRGVVQGLLHQGVGAQNIIPPGLLTAPGLQNQNNNNFLFSSSTATTTVTQATSTVPSGVIPATPAVPAVPSQGGIIATTPAVSATPAIPSVIAVTASSTATTTVPTTPPIFTITSPNGGEQFTSGNKYTITWTSTGLNVQTVIIDLYKAGNINIPIAYNVANSGSADWTIPNTLPAGSDYKIRIYSNPYYNNFDESNGLFTVVVPTAAPSVLPIGYWKLDGSGSNAIAGNPSVVTVGNASFKTSGGKFGGYLYMPTNSDYAKISYNNMFDLQNFSVEFWFRQRSNQSFNQNLISKGTPPNNYNFNIFRVLWNQYNNGAVIAGATAAGTGYWHQVSNQNEPPHNAWHHVVYTKTTEGAAYYIDGALIHSRNYATDHTPEYAGPVRTPVVDIIIGNPAPDTDMDNLKIYNYALSRGEVLYNYGNVPDTDTATPVTTAGDITAPIISQVSASSAYISLGSYGVARTIFTWVTNEYSDSLVQYYSGACAGCDGSDSTGTITNNNLVINHSVSADLNLGKTYHYTVKSKDAAGNIGVSTSYTINTPTAPVVPTIPQVQGLTVTVSGSSVNLSWQDVTSTTYSLAGIQQNMFGSYNIYRGVIADFIASLTYPNDNHIAQGSVLAYTDSNRPAGTYYYKIALQDKNGVVGPASASVSATIVPSDVTPPVISNIQVSNITPTSATIAWTTDELSDSKVFASPSSSVATSSPISSDSGNATAHTLNLSALTPATTYYYVVSSQDGVHNTVYSSQQSFTTLSDNQLTIRGRLIDKNSQQPIAGATVVTTDQGNITTDANGAFSFLANTSDITITHPKGFALYPNCHIARGGRVDRDPGYLEVLQDVFDLAQGYPQNYKYTPVNSEVNLGDVPQWPSVSFNLTSDIPVKFTIEYPEEGSSVGNSLLKTSHSLSNVLPLQYNVRAKLVDGAGAIYYSSYITLSLNQGCSPATLNFAGGQFTWTNVISSASSSSNLANILSALEETLKNMQAKLNL